MIRTIIIYHVLFFIAFMPQMLSAQEKGGKIATRAIHYEIPYGYNQLGNTNLYYQQTNYAIDIIGRFGTFYYSSTYSDGGYQSAIKINNHQAYGVDCLNGTTIDGVSIQMAVEEKNGLAQIVYTLRNNNSSIATVSLGSRADVMIGSNDRAPISRRNYLDGTTYGLLMSYDMSLESAALVLLFGENIDNVTSIDDYWFGHYSMNYDYEGIAGNYSPGSNYMEENGSYDSGLGWCWKNRVLEPNSTTTYSVLIGVGDVTLLPLIQNVNISSSDTNWDNLEVDHSIEISGTYFSPADLPGVVHYSIDNGEWVALTDTLASEAVFSKELFIRFTPYMPKHTVRLYAKDNEGAYSSIYTTSYKDISSVRIEGVEDSIYTGFPVIQEQMRIYDSETNIMLSEGIHFNKEYMNNTNPGTALIKITGIYPHYIGTFYQAFQVLPIPIESGIITFVDRVDSLCYSGIEIKPQITFNLNGNELALWTDYNVYYQNNINAGTASVIVSGTGIYGGTKTMEFQILRKQILFGDLTVFIPDEVIIYDGEEHPAIIQSSPFGIGGATFYYIKDTIPSTEAPHIPGIYSVDLSINESENYNAASFTNIGTITIVVVHPDDMQALHLLYEVMNGTNWNRPWVINEQGVSTLPGVSLNNEGRVIDLDLSSNGIVLSQSSSSVGTDSSTIAISLPYLESLNLSHNALNGDFTSFTIYENARIEWVFPRLNKLNLSYNALRGDVYSLVLPYPELWTVDLSYNQFSHMSAPLPGNILYLNVNDQFRNTQGTSYEGEENMSSQEVVLALEPSIVVPPVSAYNHSSRSFDQRPHFDLFTIEREHIAQIVSSDVYRLYSSGDWNYPSHTVFYALDNSGSFSKITFTFDDGDANIDGDVNVLDIQHTLNYIFNECTAPTNFVASDTYRDDMITVQDIIKTVGIILDKDEETSGLRSSSETNNKLFIENGKLILYTEQPVAASDISLQGVSDKDVSLLLDNTKFQSVFRNTAEGTRFVFFSPSGSVIPPGYTVIANVSTNESVGLVDAILAGPEALRIPVTILSTSTDLPQLMADDLKVSASGSIIHCYLPWNTDNLAATLYTVQGETIGKQTKKNVLAGLYDLDFHIDTPGVYVLKITVNTEGRFISKNIKVVLSK